MLLRLKMQTGFVGCWIDLLAQLDEKYPYSQVAHRNYSWLDFSLVTKEVDKDFIESLGEYVTAYQIQGDRMFVRKNGTYVPSKN